MSTAHIRSRNDRRIRAVVAWLLVLALLVVGGCGRKSEESTDEGTAPAVQPDGAVSAGDATWTAVRLGDGSDYFGRLVDLGSGMYALNATYFLTEAPPEGGGSGRIRRFGNELHRPAPQIIFPGDAVVYQQTLDIASPVRKAILEYEDGSASEVPPPAIPSGGMFAIVLRTGEVFFANVIVTGESATLSRVHYLKFKEGVAADATQIESLDQLELVPQVTSSVGPTDAMTIPISAVLYFQPLRDDSPVVEAIK